MSEELSIGAEGVDLLPRIVKTLRVTSAELANLANKLEYAPADVHFGEFAGSVHQAINALTLPMILMANQSMEEPSVEAGSAEPDNGTPAGAYAGLEGSRAEAEPAG